MNANRTIGQIRFGTSTNAITFNRNANDRLVTINTTNEPSSLGILNEKTWTTHTFNARLAISTAQTWQNTGAGGQITFTDDINLSSFVLTLDTQQASSAMTFTGASGVIAGTGGITKIGDGTVYLSGANTYTGTTTVNDGTLQINSSGAIADTSNLVIGADGTFVLNGSVNETVGSLSGSGTLFLQSGSFTTNTSADTTFSGTITDYYANFTKAGSGNLTLSGASTYGGITTISGGTLIAANNAALGSSTYGNVIASGATLGLQGGINLAESNFSLQGTGDGGAGAINNISGDNTLGASLTFDGATTISATAGTLNLTNDLSVSNAVTFDGAGNINTSGQIYGASSITKSGSGTLTFSGSGSNSFSGGFNLNEGAAVLNKNAGVSALGQGTINIGDNVGAAGSATATFQASNQILDYATAVNINSDGLLDLNGFDETLNVIGGSGQIALGSGDLGIGVNYGSSTFSGAISGSGNLEVLGGTQTLSGSNTYTGDTTVTAGTLRLGANDVLSNATDVNVGGSGTFDLNGNISVGLC